MTDNTVKEGIFNDKKKKEKKNLSGMKHKHQINPKKHRNLSAKKFCPKTQAVRVSVNYRINYLIKLMM